MDKLRQRTLTRWLRQQARLAKPWPSITVLLGGLSAGLLIGQAWLLATLLQGFIVNGLDKQSQLPQFALLLALLLLRSLLALAKEQSAFTGATRVRRALRAQLLDELKRRGPAYIQRQPAGSWASLLSPAYLTRRAELIGPQSLGRALPGVPEGATIAHAQATGPEPPSTSHLVAVDAQGRGVALTSSIEQQFGARLMVNRGRGLAGGFLLNNQLTDFSFVAEQDGRPVANRAQGGKRPRSSMAPLLAFDRSTGQLMLATGSAGGAAIIHHAAKVLLGEAWGLAPQQAADLPNFGAFNEPTTWLERDRFADSTWNALRARGHVIEATTLPSGVHTLMRRPVGGWAAGADPRREGAARGD